MDEKRVYQILVVDDDSGVRSSLALLLKSEGYSCRTAEDGFDALLMMKSNVPDLILSDLNMPQMSGFEFLSVVRRRFPQVQVIAMSGAFESGETVPGGVIADAFHQKGSNAGELLRIVSRLLEELSSQALRDRIRTSSPIWVPRSGLDSRGLPFVVLTCTDCLRSFPLNATTEATGSVVETQCIFCMETVRYVIDFSLSVASPKIRPQLNVNSPNDRGTPPSPCEL